jgi:hypothetical protein
MAEENVAVKALSEVKTGSLRDSVAPVEPGGGKSSPGRSTGLGVGTVVVFEGGMEQPGPWQAGRGAGCGASGIAMS